MAKTIVIHYTFSSFAAFFLAAESGLIFLMNHLLAFYIKSQPIFLKINEDVAKFVFCCSHSCFLFVWFDSQSTIFQG